MAQRDNFPETIKRAVAARVGSICSNPTCRAPTSAPHEEADKAVNLGVAAHITAAAPGGARYDPNITAVDRASAENALWLCHTCAKLIDSDPGRFPVSLLRNWKATLEEDARLRAGKTAVTPKFASVRELRIDILHGAMRDAAVCIQRLTSYGGPKALSSDILTSFRESYANFQRARLDAALYIRADTAAILEEMALALSSAHLYRTQGDVDGWRKSDEYYDKFEKLFRDSQAQLRVLLNSVENNDE